MKNRLTIMVALLLAPLATLHAADAPASTKSTRSNILFIYTSDNGYFMGEHTLGDKRFAYDEILRIPLLLRYPKIGLKPEHSPE
jgi:hypothetical protein